MKEKLIKLLKLIGSPKTLGSIAILEAIIILSLFGYIFQQKRLGIIEKEVLASSSESIDQAISACNQLPPTERPACAEKVGIKIATLFENPEEQILQCMKLRPLWVRYCQQGLLFP